MKIIIETIPHLSQRYNTCGDWQWEGNTLHVKISEMGLAKDYSTDYAEMIIGIHEAIEALLCKFDGVSEKQVDEFDRSKTIQGEIEKLEIEPGDHPKAPYRRQHLLATGIEKILCVLFHIPWFEYEERLIRMTEEYMEVHGE